MDMVKKNAMDMLNQYGDRLLKEKNQKSLQGLKNLLDLTSIPNRMRL